MSGAGLGAGSSVTGFFQIPSNFFCPCVFINDPGDIGIFFINIEFEDLIKIFLDV